MADQRHLKKLEEGVHAWNQWRKEHLEILPDLRKADLCGRMLSGVDFRRTNLDAADLSDARLNSAFLDRASLCRTNLSKAQLRHAHLHQTCLKETNLQQTSFHQALLLDTAFLNVDLSTAINLETLIHLGPSTIGIDTIQQSRGMIPDVFLLGARVSEQLLDCIRSSGHAPFDYHTCFISYASQDQHFVDILYEDLRRVGVRCWSAPASLRAGEKFQQCITEAVQSREKLLVVLSKNSIQSKWVTKEVELARQREGKGKREVLVPISLDNSVLNSTLGWVASIRNHRHMRNFEHWKQPPCYQKQLDDLLNDLRK